MSTFDDPNREAVGVEPAWVEGTGGEAGEVPVDPGAPGEPTPETKTYNATLDDMTKDELLAHAKEVGATPANASMSKDELRESIEAART